MNNLKLKRMFFVLALVLVIGVTATGCMNQDGNGMLLDNMGDSSNGQVTQPSPSPNYMPQGSTDGQNASGGQSAANGANGANGAFDWTNNSAQIEQRIGQISEIEDARVVVTGDTALVGVHFDRAYQGEMTERIREMVAAEVMAADPQITTVAVTADNDDVGNIFDISDRSRAGRDLDTLKEDIEEIVRNATTLR